MATYKKVLVAIDMLGGANDILNKAADLFAKGDTEIIVLNVVYISPQMYGGFLGAGPYITASLTVNEDDICQSVRPKMEVLIKEFRLPKHRLLIECGHPVDTILDCANKQGADLIMIGSHGKHGVGLLLGSTANGVLHKSNCDVLAIRIKEPSE